MNAQTQHKVSNVLEISGLKKSFGDNEILKDISLTLENEEILAILGQSGMGKSVLLKCIVNLVTPDDGLIKVNGKEISTLNEKEINQIRQKIGYLFQGAALYDSMTIEENLRFPLERSWSNISEEEKNKRIDEALESVGLLNAKKKMPSEMSGGMKKRAGLARTLIMKPEIILYDEPTTGLDPVTSDEISKLILDVKDRYKTAAIIVSHDIRCVKKTSDKVLFLENGSIVEQGTLKQLKETEEKNVKRFFNNR